MNMLKAIMTYALQSNDLNELEEILQSLESLRFVKNQAYQQSLAATIIAISNHKAALDEYEDIADKICPKK